MSMKAIIEDAIKKLEAERDRKANEVKDTVTREQIIPFNADIDKAREKAIAELQAALTASITALQEKFAKEKADIIAAGEKMKADNASAVIACATYTVTVTYDKTISALRQEMEHIKE